MFGGDGVCLVVESLVLVENDWRWSPPSVSLVQLLTTSDGGEGERGRRERVCVYKREVERETRMNIVHF